MPHPWPISLHFLTLVLSVLAAVAAVASSNAAVVVVVVVVVVHTLSWVAQFNFLHSKTLKGKSVQLKQRKEKKLEEESAQKNCSWPLLWPEFRKKQKTGFKFRNILPKLFIFNIC